MKSMRMGGIATMLGWLAMSVPAAAADVQDIMHDTQQMTMEDGQMSMVWWIPVQYWDESIKTNPNVPDAARAQVVDAMSDYAVFGLLRARPGAAGLGDVQSKEELVKNLHLEMNGETIQPLTPEQIAPATSLMLAQLKPALAAGIGQFGKALEFVVFPATVDGKPLIDATQPGELTATFYGKEHRWHLPLGSLLPPKVDKKTGEQFPGNYKFNPYTGKKLADQ